MYSTHAARANIAILYTSPSPSTHPPANAPPTPLTDLHAHQVNSGTAYWNCGDRVSPFLPWSGRKGSGVGATLSTIGIQSFVIPKGYHLRA